MDHLKSSSPSLPLGINKKNYRPSALPCPQKSWGDKSQRQRLDCHWQRRCSYAILYRIQLPRAWAMHYNVVWVPTPLVIQPTDSILTASMAWLWLSCWTLSKQETIGAAPALDMDAGRAINSWCLLFSNLTFGSCPCLEGSPLSGVKGSRQTQRHIRSVFSYQNSFKDLADRYLNIV